MGDIHQSWGCVHVKIRIGLLVRVKAPRALWQAALWAAPTGRKPKFLPMRAETGEHLAQDNHACGNRPNEPGAANGE